MKDQWKKPRRGIRAARRRTAAWVAGGRQLVGGPAVAAAATHRTTVKTFTNAVLAIVNKKEETKYVASEPVLPATGIISTITLPAGLVPYIPPVVQGVASNQRIGQKISNVHGRVDFQFYLIPNVGAKYPTEDIMIKLFKLTSKAVKSYQQISAIQAGTLLDIGSQASTDWTNPAFAISYSQMPISREDFSGSTHTIRMRKNQGTPSGDLGSSQSPNTYGYGAKSYSFTWKHKGNLLYDDTGINNPTNYAPIYAVVAYNPDNTLYDGLCQYTCRSHMWFKDV